MSGTFKDVHVPPMLMAFGITTVDSNQVISTDFKGVNNYIYLVKHEHLNKYLPNIEQLKENYKNINKAIAKKKIVSAYALGFGGLAEAVAKMSFGNKIGYNITVSEDELFNLSYGSILVESNTELHFGTLIGMTTNEVAINGVEFDLEEMLEANTVKFEEIYRSKTDVKGTLKVESYEKKTFAYPYEAKVPTVYVPVFPGTNCDYDTIKAFKNAGANITTSVFKNITEKDIEDSINEMADYIKTCDIFMLSGGFSAGDEPDGSAKFIANVLMAEKVKAEIDKLIERKGLILGICNGFQALVKSGLLPYSKLGELSTESPTLFRNDINRHISQMVTTRVSSTNSPWLSSFNDGDLHTIAVSHGEGKFVVSEKMYEDLKANGQIAFQYVDYENNPTMESPMNPNGSSYAIEGIVSKDGLILGKMGHTERYETNVFKNIYGNKFQNIFENAMNYFMKK